MAKKFKPQNLNTLLGVPDAKPKNVGPAVRSAKIKKPDAKPKGLVSLGGGGGGEKVPVKGRALLSAEEAEKKKIDEERAVLEAELKKIEDQREKERVAEEERLELERQEQAELEAEEQRIADEEARVAKAELDSDAEEESGGERSEASSDAEEGSETSLVEAEGGTCSNTASTVPNFSPPPPGPAPPPPGPTSYGPPPAFNPPPNPGTPGPHGPPPSMPAPPVPGAKARGEIASLSGSPAKVEKEPEVGDDNDQETIRNKPERGRSWADQSEGMEEDDHPHMKVPPVPHTPPPAAPSQMQGGQEAVAADEQHDQRRQQPQPLPNRWAVGNPLVADKPYSQSFDENLDADSPRDGDRSLSRERDRDNWRHGLGLGSAAARGFKPRPQPGRREQDHEDDHEDERDGEDASGARRMPPQPRVNRWALGNPLVEDKVYDQFASLAVPSYPARRHPSDDHDDRDDFGRHEGAAMQAFRGGRPGAVPADEADHSFGSRQGKGDGKRERPTRGDSPNWRVPGGPTTDDRSRGQEDRHRGKGGGGHSSPVNAGYGMLPAFAPRAPQIMTRGMTEEFENSGWKEKKLWAPKDEDDGNKGRGPRSRLRAETAKPAQPVPAVEASVGKGADRRVEYAKDKPQPPGLPEEAKPQQQLPRRPPAPPPLEAEDSQSGSDDDDGPALPLEYTAPSLENVPRTALVMNVSHVLKRLKGCCSLIQLMKALKAFKEKTGITLEEFIRANPMTFRLEGRIVYLVDRNGEKWQPPEGEMYDELQPSPKAMKKHATDKGNAASGGKENRQRSDKDKGKGKGRSDKQNSGEKSDYNGRDNYGSWEDDYSWNAESYDYEQKWKDDTHDSYGSPSKRKGRGKNDKSGQSWDSSAGWNSKESWGEDDWYGDNSQSGYRGSKENGYSEGYSEYSERQKAKSRNDKNKGKGKSGLTSKYDSGESYSTYDTARWKARS